MIDQIRSSAYFFLLGIEVSMQVFVAGSTGVLGRRLVELFSDHGHTAIGLTRDKEGDELVEARGGTPRRGDLFDEASVIQAASGADVVIHAATAIPTDDPTPEKWAINDRIRCEGTRTLITAAAETGADQYLQQSIVWVARQPDETKFDEESTLHPNSRAESAVDAEAIATKAVGQHDLTVSILRCGQFYAPDAAHTRALGNALVHGTRPIIDGSEAAPLSRIHADDAASAFVAATEASNCGLWHIVDNEPVSDVEFTTTFADRLDAPTPMLVSEEKACRELGDGTVDLLTKPMPTSNAKLRTDVGWEPAYPTYRDGLDQVVDAWRDEEFLV